MAFAFFRRRQKMVIAIMAGLMILFVVGPTAVQRLASRNPSDVTLGTIRGGKVTYRDRENAERQIQMLEFLRLRDPEFTRLTMGNGDQAPLAYALLLKEAQQHEDIRIGRQDVDDYLQQIGLVGDDYQGYVSQLRARNIPEKYFRSAVARWLKVRQLYAEAAVVAPPTETEMEIYYRDLHEQVKLRMVRIPAERFLGEVEEPDEETIRKQFRDFRDVPAGAYSPQNPFGFGYRQPERVNILALLVRADVLERATEPSEKDLLDYYLRHESEFTKAPPTASQPASEDSTGPVGFAEAKPQIIAKLKPEAVKAKLDQLVRRVRALVRQFSEDPLVGQEDIYRRARQGMVLPAERLLAIRMHDVNMVDLPLQEAVARLAERAGIMGICYPWGPQEAGELDPSVKVTVKAGAITLGEALARIAEQLDWPARHWALCRDMGDVLFSVAVEQDGIDFFPIRVYESGLIDRRQCRRDPLLGACFTSSGRPLAEIAFNVGPLAAARKVRPLAAVGVEGATMQSIGSQPGAVVWRVAEALAAQRPEGDEPTGEVRKQVITDLKRTKAFALAQQYARELLERSDGESLAALAEAEGLEVVETDFFGRRMKVWPRSEMVLRARSSGRFDAETLASALLARPLDYATTRLPQLPLPTLADYIKFVRQAFTLVPQDGEDPPSETVAAMQSIGEVLILKRLDYRPAYREKFQETGREELAQELMAIRFWMAQQTWFTLANIQGRLDYYELSPQG